MTTNIIIVSLTMRWVICWQMMTHPLEHRLGLLRRDTVVHEVHESDTLEGIEDGLCNIIFGGSVKEWFEVDDRDPMGIPEKDR